MVKNLASINIRFRADIKGFSKSMDNVNRKLKSFSKKMTAAGQNLTLGLTAPIVAFGATSLAVFTSFEDAMAKVKAISGATGIEFKKLQQNAEDLGASTRFTASEVANLQLNFSKLGFKPDQILNATEATLQLALATGEDLAQSATVAASTLNGFGLEATETQRVVDVMAASFSSSALDLSKFQTAMATLAPVAKNAGVSFEGATGQLAVLVNAGIDASTAGTALRNIYLTLAGSGMTLKESLEQISNSTNKNATAFNLFGKRGATVGAVLADNYKEAQIFTTEFENAGGTAAAMAKIMDDTAAGSLARLKSAIEAVGISFGRSLAPTFRLIADNIAILAAKFSGLEPATKKIIVIIGALAAAIGPLLLVLGFLTSTILPALVAGMTLLLGPVGLVIAALVAVGVAIYKNWEPIKKILVDIANYFIDLYNESVVLRLGVNAIILNFENLWSIIKFVFNNAFIIIKAFITQLVKNFEFLGQIIKGALTLDFKTIKDGVAGFVSNTKNNISNLIDSLKGNFKDLSVNIGDNLKNALENVKNRTKIKLDPKNINTDAVQDKVASAVKKGLKGEPSSGGSEPGRPIQENSGLASGLNTQGPTSLTGLDLTEDLPLAEFDTFIEAADGMQEKFEKLKESAQLVSQAVANAFSGMVGRLIGSFELADNGFQGFVKNLAGTIGELITMLLSASIAQAILGAQTAGAATGPLAVITSPAFIATAVGGVLAAFASIPKFAEGGVITGETLAVVGDNKNARFDPEIIAPLSKLRDYMTGNNGGNTNISLGLGTTIKGNDLELIIDRVLTKKLRY